MIEIGKTKLVPVRTRVKDNDGKAAFHKVIGVDGQPEVKVTNADVWRVCRDPLGGMYGRDKHRKLVVGLVAVDQLVLYPKGTRQEVRVNLKDIYAWALRSRVLRSQLERARERKDRLKTARERRNIAAADRRIRLAAKIKREAR
jgi:hypothetical protein